MKDTMLEFFFFLESFWQFKAEITEKVSHSSSSIGSDYQKARTVNCKGAKAIFSFYYLVMYFCTSWTTYFYIFPVSGDKKEDSEYTKYSSAELQGNEKLFNYIRNDLLQNPRIVRWSELYPLSTSIVNSHTICTFLAVIGKRFQDAGLRDVCVESGVIADRSAAGVLEGRSYKLPIWFHKIMFEALNRIVRNGFQQWIEEHHEDKKPRVDELMKGLTPLI